MSDEADILEIHERWWDCNRTGDIPRMATCFARGANYLMYNLNGHPYFGIEEKQALWSWYSTRLAISEPDIRIQQMIVDGDVAWIACEGVQPTKVTGEPGTGSSTWQVRSTRYEQSLIRATEVFRRDDGDGNPVWRIWHFHCSPMAPSDETRPGFHDSGRRRGLGAISAPRTELGR